MKHVMRLAFAGLCLTLGSGPALADWTMSFADDPDGRGRPAILLGEAEDGRWLQFWCRGDERRIAILVNDGQNDDPSGVSATLEISPDTGATWSSPADFYRHDANWLGLSYRNIADMRGMLDDIIEAQGNIGIVIGGGGDAPDIYMSATAKGSTAAGRQFAAACFAATPSAAPAAPAVVEPPSLPAAGGTAAWFFEAAPDPNGGTEVTLVADLDQGGYFYAYCDARQQPSLAFVSRNPSTFPYARGDANLRIIVQVDGSDTAAAGEYFSLDAETQGILFNDFSVLERLIRQVGAAQSSVAMQLERASDNMVTRWPALNLNGLQQGAAQFVAHCWGQPAPAVSTPAPAPVPVTPTPAPAPVQPATPAAPAVQSDWVVAHLPASSRFTLQMAPPADNADATLRIACNPKESLRTIGIFDRRGFAGDGTYEMTVTIVDDGRSWTLASTRPERSDDGVPGVVSTDAQVLFIPDALSVSKQALRVDLVHAAGARRTYRFSPSTAAGPATDMYFGCLGE